MAQICAAGIPNASEFARRRVHLPRSRAAKKPRARVTGSLAFSFGRNFPAPVMGDLSPSLTATAAAGILYPFRYPSCRTLR